MVVPTCVQNTGSVKSQNTTTPLKNSANKNTVNKITNNNNNNNNTNNYNKKNRNINKSSDQEEKENKCCVVNSKSEKLSQKNNKQVVTVTNRKDGEEKQQQSTTLSSPSKAVDAKEVEKLLQDALWKGQQQQQKKSHEGAESVSSGGCDTGYSSRCSTPPSPPSPPSLPPDQMSSLEDDPKHGTKRHLDVPLNTTITNNSNGTRESRSESPSACSVSSQGSYRNPRQKRRYNNHVEGYSNQYHNNGHYHHNHHHYQQHHNQQQYPNHYPYHQQGDGYGGGYGRGNNQYYHYTDLPARDCTNYQGRKYERGCNYGYRGQYNNFYREMNYYHGDGYRYNQGKGGYNNRYQNNQRNYYNENFPPLNNGSARDQTKPVSSERAGTFSNECVSDNKQWKCEVVNTPQDLLTGSEWDDLSQQVWNMFRKHQQTDKTFLKKLKLKDKIFKVIRNVLPSCRLYVVGSSLSGFGADWSDVDMCLMVTPGDLDQRNEATAVLSLLQRELNNCGSTQKMELIPAKVPILKFRDAQSRVDVDLNCNNAVGIRNTHLLHSYSQLDWRVRPLVLVVKLWAQHHDINNAKDMTISSYSLVLMVIHYLQHGVEPPVLPCLQKNFPEKFHAHALIMSIPITERMPTFTSKNHDTLGQLFHGFLSYFAKSFTYIEDTISVRTGGTIPTSQCRSVKSRKNDSRMWKYLCIEEPFDLTNTARSMYDEAAFERVRKVFADSYKFIDEKRDLSTIM